MAMRIPWYTNLLRCIPRKNIAVTPLIITNIIPFRLNLVRTLNQSAVVSPWPSFSLFHTVCHNC